MKGKSTKRKSSTDWERIDAMSDEAIDTSEVPPLDKEFFKNARLRLPEGKTLITIRLDSDVLKWLKAHGPGYQTRINAILKAYMSAAKEHRISE
jgi:uncharacterized protein (DUF4415 family)